MPKHFPGGSRSAAPGSHASIIPLLVSDGVGTGRRRRCRTSCSVVHTGRGVRNGCRRTEWRLAYGYFRTPTTISGANPADRLSGPFGCASPDSEGFPGLDGVLPASVDDCAARTDFEGGSFSPGSFASGLVVVTEEQVRQKVSAERLPSPRHIVPVICGWSRFSRPPLIRCCFHRHRACTQVESVQCM